MTCIFWWLCAKMWGEIRGRTVAGDNLTIGSTACQIPFLDKRNGQRALGCVGRQTHQCFPEIEKGICKVNWCIGHKDSQECPVAEQVASACGTRIWNKGVEAALVTSCCFEQDGYKILVLLSGLHKLELQNYGILREKIHDNQIYESKGGTHLDCPNRPLISTTWMYFPDSQGGKAYPGKWLQFLQPLK